MSDFSTNKIREMSIYEKIRAKRIRCDDYSITWTNQNGITETIATARCPETVEIIRDLLDNIEALLTAYDAREGGAE